MLILTAAQQAILDQRFIDARDVMFPFSIGTIPWETGNRIRKDYEFELWSTQKIALPNFDVDGSIGTAVDTVDNNVFILVQQTSEDIDLTLPTPTVTNVERNCYVGNTGVFSFTVNGTTIRPNLECRFYWNVALQTWQDKEIDAIDYYFNQLSIYSIYNGAYVSVLEIISSPVVGAGQQIAISSTSVQSDFIPAKIVDLTATQYCWISYGDDPVAAKPTGYLLSPNMPYRIGIAYGDKIAVIRDSTAADGTLSICPVIPNV